MSDSYTEEEVQAAVNAALAPLHARIQELEQSQQVSEVESAKAEVRADLETKIVELQKQLDESVLQASSEKVRADELVAWLEDEGRKIAEAETMNARKDERLAKIREVASFPEDYLEKNAERFAAMSDEDFEVAVEGWKAISTAKPEGTVPSQTALHASRESEGSRPNDMSAIKEIIGLRRGGRVDLTSL